MTVQNATGRTRPGVWAFPHGNALSDWIVAGPQVRWSTMRRLQAVATVAGFGDGVPRYPL
jgi:hypothetical protein